MENLNLPWPCHGHKMIMEGKSLFSSADLHFVERDWYRYSEGYKIAGDWLSIEYLSRHGEERYYDHLIMPILNTYRHYIELMFKLLTIYGSILLFESPKYKQTHSLKDLYSQCKEILNKIAQVDILPETEIIEEWVNEFDSLDPRGQSFRYPKDQKGNDITLGINSIDVENLHERIQSLHAFLEAAWIEITVSLQDKLEWEKIENEVQREYEAEFLYFS